MKLTLENSTPPPFLSDDLDVAIVVKEGSPPEMFVPEGRARHDRHLILGLAQTARMAAQEWDPESIAPAEGDRAVLERGQRTDVIDNGIIIIRSVDGGFGVVALTDRQSARRLSREAERYFTGSIRLDVP